MTRFDPLPASQTRPLHLDDNGVVTLDSNGLATAGPTQLGDTIRVSLQDIAGPGYDDPTDGITIIWPALDPAGRHVTQPFGYAEQDVLIVARPEDLDSTVVIQAGNCTSTAAGEYHGFGLYYNDADDTVHRHSVWSGTAAATSDLGVTRVNRYVNVSTYGGSVASDEEARRYMMGGLPSNDSGEAYTTYVTSTGAADLTGEKLYHYVTIFPTAALGTEQTVAFQVRAQALGRPGGSRAWRSAAGAETVWWIGDSITAEVQSAAERLYSWRYLINEAFVRRAPIRDVIDTGHLADSHNPVWRRHSGVGGATAASTLTNIDTYKAGLDRTPDIAFIMLGINDAGGAVGTTAFLDDIQLIIDDIAAAYPGIAIYFAVSNPTTDGTNDARLVGYEGSAGTLTGCTVVDMRTGFNTGTMLDDATHPNVAGHAYIAGQIDDAVSLAGD